MSSKTPRGAAAKTAWARKTKVICGLIAVFVLATFIFADTKNVVSQVDLGTKSYQVEVVRSDPGREKGLSDRLSLPSQNGMLFIFDDTTNHCFWMKEMNFPLDIIWFDAGKKIVHVEKNLQPDSYPASFCPDTSAPYVLELNANAFAASGAQLGDFVQFK